MQCDQNAHISYFSRCNCPYYGKAITHQFHCHNSDISRFDSVAVILGTNNVINFIYLMLSSLSIRFKIMLLSKLIHPFVHKLVYKRGLIVLRVPRFNEIFNVHPNTARICLLMLKCTIHYEKTYVNEIPPDHRANKIKYIIIVQKSGKNSAGYENEK